MCSHLCIENVRIHYLNIRFKTNVIDICGGCFKKSPAAEFNFNEAFHPDVTTNYSYFTYIITINKNLWIHAVERWG